MVVMYGSTRNVAMLGVAMFFTGVAYNTAGFVVEPVVEAASHRLNIHPHAGYYSLSVVYAVFTLGNFIATPLVDILTPKWAMCLATSGYIAYCLSFLWLNTYLLYATSVFVGICASLLWIGQGSYIAQNSTEKNLDRNSAIVLVLTQLALIAGGTFLFSIFEFSVDTNKYSGSMVQIIFLSFAACCIVSTVITAVLPNVNVTVSDKSYFKLLGETTRLMFTADMMLLSVVFAFSGFEMAIWAVVFPTSVAFTKSLLVQSKSILALVSIATGVGQVGAALSFYFVGKKAQSIGRKMIVFFGAFVNSIAFILIWASLPSEASLRTTEASGPLIEPRIWISLIVGLMLGVADTVWCQQIVTIICEKFPLQATSAFAIFRFVQTALTSCVMYGSTVVSLSYQMAVGIVGCVAACVAFSIVERRTPESS
ncbi:unnamed protein product [Caenorhabditis auriculariae]|uniref:Uncharacterized protein n=1 Tax=Caenorhabditis auriculariae TaxID=2777116 RepID=A0A8S1HH32_9PELO|nr:unnamed protein product [Caenorhabditis auriculariae]